MSSDDEEVPVVFDQGSETLKVGFAGDDMPNHIIPTVVGYPSQYGIDDEKPEDCWVFGENAFNDQYKYSIQVRHPIEKKLVTNWDLMEKLWNFVFYQKLRVAPEEQAVMLTEPVLNPKVNREKTSQIMFETFNVPATYLIAQPLLSLYTTGEVTGIVIDSGYGGTHIVPVYEGYIKHHGIRHLPICGCDLTDFIKKAIQGHFSSTTPDSVITEASKKIKETLCYVRDDSNEKRTPVTYTLPDGKEISLGDELFKCPEALFDPSLLGHECSGIIETLYSSINNLDVEIRKRMYDHIVLSGGNTLFPGMAKRVEKDITLLDKTSLPKHVNNGVGNEQKFSAWIGGSILASLNSFEEMWVTKKEYDEKGPIIVKEKCQNA